MRPAVQSKPKGPIKGPISNHLSFNWILNMVIDLQSKPKVHKLFHGLFAAKGLFCTVTYLRSLNSCTLNTFGSVKRTSEYNGI